VTNKAIMKSLCYHDSVFWAWTLRLYRHCTN